MFLHLAAGPYAYGTFSMVHCGILSWGQPEVIALLAFRIKLTNSHDPSPILPEAISFWQANAICKLSLASMVKAVVHGRILVIIICRDVFDVLSPDHFTLSKPTTTQLLLQHFWHQLQQLYQADMRRTATQASCFWRKFLWIILALDSAVWKTSHDLWERIVR